MVLRLQMKNCQKQLNTPFSKPTQKSKSVNEHTNINVENEVRST